MAQNAFVNGWLNVNLSDATLKVIGAEIATVFQNQFGAEMPKDFGQWSLRKQRGSVVIGFPEDAVAKALKAKPEATKVPKGKIEDGGVSLKALQEQMAAMMLAMQAMGAGAGVAQTPASTKVPKVKKAA